MEGGGSLLVKRGRSSLVEGGGSSSVMRGRSSLVEGSGSSSVGGGSLLSVEGGSSLLVEVRRDKRPKLSTSSNSWHIVFASRGSAV